MRLAAIHIYPVKSCRGISLETAALDDLGLAGDRRFMIVTPAGKFLTQRSHPGMALISTALTADTLTLATPTLPPLKIARVSPPATSAPAIPVEIWKDQNLLAEDCGSEAADWLGTHLGEPTRLVRIGQQFLRPVKTTNPHTRSGDIVSFADGYPLLVISEASLTALNQRLASAGEPPVPMDRFRPNLVLADCDAHAEDTAPHLRIGNVGETASGPVIIRAAGPCARCIITTTDQQTATRRGPEPLRTLATYRRDPAKPTDVNFGQNYIHETKNGTLRVGDPVSPSL